MAPQVGFEPTTDRLTADCSTTELLWNIIKQIIKLNLHKLFWFDAYGPVGPRRYSLLVLLPTELLWNTQVNID